MNKEIDFSFLSRERGALMGFAILWIYLYHQGTIGLIGYDQFIPNGWAGVEIFFLLSAMGLCYSLQKNGDVASFFKRRVVRIVPTWWVIITIGTIILFASQSVDVPNTWWKLFGWYSGIGWWLHGFMPDPKGSSFEWYIPTLLAFYAATPWLYKMNKRTLWTLLFASIVLGLAAAYMSWGKSVYMSWQRIPVYLLGLIIYRMGGARFWKVAICFVVGLFFFGIGFMFKDNDVVLSLTLRRYGMLGILPVLLYGVAYITSRVKWIKSSLAFLGAISMEIYLIHINPDVFHYLFDGVKPLMPFPVFVFVSFAIVILMAYAIHVAMKPVLKRLG